MMSDPIGVIQQQQQLIGKIYVAGTRGYSNYEIAVQNGFEGTEAEWLDKITQDEADIVWQRLISGQFGFELNERYNSQDESLILDIIPIEGDE